jgi:hypothetical protein
VSVVTGSLPTRSERVRVRSYAAHTDGLKDAAPMRAGECRHYSSVEGVATGLKLIGPHPGDYRDWVLEGLFEMTDAATGQRTQACRMYNRDRSFFMSVKDVLRAGKRIEFSYEFYVERLAVGGGLKERLKITRLLALETYAHRTNTPGAFNDKLDVGVVVVRRPMTREVVEERRPRYLESRNKRLKKC